VPARTRRLTQSAAAALSHKARPRNCPVTLPMWNDQLMPVDDRLKQTQRLYERAVFGGDASALVDAERHLSGVEADLALARGRVAHARFLAATSGTLPGPDDVGDELVLFERASELYGGLGDLRGEAEAQFWIGTFHQVVRHDDVVAVPALERARALATEAENPLTLSYALRHLELPDIALANLRKHAATWRSRRDCVGSSGLGRGRRQPRGSGLPRCRRRAPRRGAGDTR